MKNKSENKNIQTQNIVNNKKLRDNRAKVIFDDPTLCAEFLRGYVDVDLLKNVQPEDIEDVSERFIPMWQEERDSDSVKKIHLKDTSLYLITIIEHQSKVHYDMSFRMLRYIVMVLTDYENEQERLHKGITKTKDFKYPPVIPIIYYEGTDPWTATRSFKERVHLSDVLGDYIPDFKYLVVPIQEYSNEDILAKKDALSLIMLINKLTSYAEFRNLADIPKEYLEDLQKAAPEYLSDVLCTLISVLLYRLNVPKEEVENFTDQIRRREFSMLFENFEAYDVQAVRKESREDGKREGKIEGLLEALISVLEDKNSIPDDLKSIISAEKNPDTLNRWLKLAAKATSINEFREKAGI